MRYIIDIFQGELEITVIASARVGKCSPARFASFHKMSNVNLKETTFSIRVDTKLLYEHISSEVVYYQHMLKHVKDLQAVVDYLGMRFKDKSYQVQ